MSSYLPIQADEFLIRNLRNHLEFEGESQGIALDSLAGFHGK